MCIFSLLPSCYICVCSLACVSFSVRLPCRSNKYKPSLTFIHWSRKERVTKEQKKALKKKKKEKDDHDEEEKHDEKKEKEKEKAEKEVPPKPRPFLTKVTGSAASSSGQAAKPASHLRTE